MHSIYLITNIKNNKHYVGKTKRDIFLRFQEHKWLNVNTYIHKAIKTFGIENFKVELLEKVEDCNALNREKYYTDFYDCLYPKGYNEMKGQSLEGGNNRMKGKQLPKEWSSKCACKGIQNGRACKWCIHWLDTNEKIYVDLRQGIADYLHISLSLVKKYRNGECHIDTKTGRPVRYYNVGKVDK